MTNAEEKSPAAWRALAEAAGLGALNDEEVATLARATLALRRHVDRLPKDLPPETNPALIFRPWERQP